MIWIDPEHDLVTVLRWIDKAKIDGFFSRLLAARPRPDGKAASIAASSRRHCVPDVRMTRE